MAIGVGISIEKERIALLLAAVALAASAVSVTGGIAFIGLMAPHIAKSLVGPRHQLFVPVAILIGGWLLLFADTIGRNVNRTEWYSRRNNGCFNRCTLLYVFIGKEIK